MDSRVFHAFASREWNRDLVQNHFFLTKLLKTHYFPLTLEELQNYSWRLTIRG